MQRRFEAIRELERKSKGEDGACCKNYTNCYESRHLCLEFEPFILYTCLILLTNRATSNQDKGAASE